ncbi:ergosterol biosynthesis ERG4/ERG24 [Cadophora sp. MPI-SDFR-AT-0126]|nr:ergosterol biosynthesis ERG4/ERG24 [Leotiomycetes sp. MPI-SDFR-AT-0126]
MEPTISRIPSLHSSDIPPSSLTTNLLRKSRRQSLSTPSTTTSLWGRRYHHGTWLHSISCLCIMLSCPCLVIFYWISLSSFNGSLFNAGISIFDLKPSKFISTYAPRLDATVTLWYFAWLAFQVVLFQYLPTKISTGQLTPAGHRLEYRTNGLLAWLVSHVLFSGAVAVGIVDAAIIAKNWGQLLVVANLTGFLLAGLAYLKARVWPTYEKDSKFSGSFFYDLYMGVELNPRIGQSFDFKLFTNTRPGIVAWTLIDLSFLALQKQLHGCITNSIILATSLHTIYVLDLFINEDWYVRTIDITHDHFGFYLGWGSLAWLPSMYTLQVQYLALHNPPASDLSDLATVCIACVGVAAYALFRSVNYQKDLVRRTEGECMIWGRKAKVLRVKYRTGEGGMHSTVLSCGGWWGLARHVNYVGDLVMAYAMCATCGLENLLPWTYAIFMTILLIHRSWRDEERCAKKYGKGWEAYCEKVRWTMIPGFY